MKYYLGIDTSCYTTSLAVLNAQGELIGNARKLLTVKAGKRGLAQSEMVFQHTRNMPALFEQLCEQIGTPLPLAAIGVSAYPRPVANSYMPAFLVGTGFARSLAAVQGVVCHALSHQENHIFAGIWSAGGPVGSSFLAVHLSGGTTEIVHVHHDGAKRQIKLIGGSKDLHAGQFIDRIGVALELPFPAGPYVEKLAQTAWDRAAHIPVAASGTTISFSGPESHAQRLIAKGEDSAAIAAGVEICVAKSVGRMIEAAVRQTGTSEVLMVGGVTANLFIRQYLQHSLCASGSIRLYFPDKAYSGDNAVGAAYFALKQ